MQIRLCRSRWTYDDFPLCCLYRPSLSHMEGAGPLLVLRQSFQHCTCSKCPARHLRQTLWSQTVWTSSSRPDERRPRLFLISFVCCSISEWEKSQLYFFNVANHICAYYLVICLFLEIIIQQLATSSILTSLQEQHSLQPMQTQVSQPKGQFIQPYKHDLKTIPCWNKHSNLRVDGKV